MSCVRKAANGNGYVLKRCTKKIQHMNFLKSVGHRHSMGHCHPALRSSAVVRTLSAIPDLSRVKAKLQVKKFAWNPSSARVTAQGPPSKYNVDSRKTSV